MSQLNTIAEGVKGSDVYTVTGVENPLVAMSVQLVRGVSEDVVYNHVIAVLSSLTPENRVELLQDLLVLTFQTRDVRGGKGERRASALIWDALFKCPETKSLALDLLDLVPEYGCWQDMFKLPPVAWSRVQDIMEAQFLKDELGVCNGAGASLLAKWMPREGQPFANFCASRLVPGQLIQATRMKLYRKRVSALNKAINTVEIKMCANTWDTIDPSIVPGRAVKKYTKAFLNELGTRGKYDKPREGLRHPESVVRMLCREHFQEYFSKAAEGNVKAKGADTIFPHEVVKKAMDLYRQDQGASEDEKNSLRGVWRQMVDVARSGGGLGKSLAMCDFSGSMQSSGSNGDTPYWVSMALGLLISEVTTDEFKNTMLTFDSRPTLHTLPEGDLFAKIASIQPTMAQGMSTDFQKAMDLVLERLKAQRVRPGNEPKNLIVLTDMNWDEACGSSEYSPYTGNSYRNVVKKAPWQTHVEMIREAFKRAGEDMWGEPFKMPTIVIWNIAATSPDFHATANTEGVMMISGWSPSLFKVLQEDGPEAAVMTPLRALKLQLDHARYNRIRTRVREWFLKSSECKCADVTTDYLRTPCSHYRPEPVYPRAL